MTAQTINHNDLEVNMEGIYRAHNGLVLEGYLKYLTQDNTFKYVETSCNKYEFKNDDGKSVILCSNGELFNHVNVNPEFLNVSKWRIGRTNKMLNMLYN